MEDTISAVATPFGEGGIGIIRISGENALAILDRLFVPKNAGEGPSSLNDRKLRYGHIIDPSDGSVVDEVLAVAMKGPSTYTGEDVCEIDCHGGVIPLRRTLELTYREGARPADRGEFTKRAFLSGRIDLSQAEAVMDIVKAKAEKSFDVAMDQLEGRLSKSVEEVRDILKDLLVELTVNIDYPDEDIEELTYEKLADGLEKAVDKTKILLAGSDTGRMVRDGIRISIIGRPNVGKSSLMNALLKESRAIVTDIPGTTRDTIEETLSVNGIPVVLTDTAGIRESDDEIEAIGIERSKESFNKADLAVFMIDSSRELGSEDRMIAEHIDPAKTIVLLNKSDMGKKVSADDIRKLLPGEPLSIIETSMVSDDPTSAIENEISGHVMKGSISQEESVMVTNARHIRILENAEKSLNDAKSAASNEEPLELIEIDVKDAYMSLGEITGESVTDDILDEVFSRFCLGK